MCAANAAALPWLPCCPRVQLVNEGNLMTPPQVAPAPAAIGTPAHVLGCVTLKATGCYAAVQVVGERDLLMRAIMKNDLIKNLDSRLLQHNLLEPARTVIKYCLTEDVAQRPLPSDLLRMLNRIYPPPGSLAALVAQLHNAN
jgi:hypothetical protein